MDTLISNVTAVTMDEQMHVYFGAFIGIEGGKITYIGQTAPEGQPKTILDGTGMVAMPGLVNCHTHLATTALRHYTDDLSGAEALKVLLEKEAKLDDVSAKASATLGIAECLRFGITSVSDLGIYPQAVAQAAAESGIKANIAMACSLFTDENEDFDFEKDTGCIKLRDCVDAFHGYAGGRIRIDAGIHAEYTGNYKLWEALSSYAEEKDLGFQLHLSEAEAEEEDCQDRTGLSQTELLNCHRIFSRGAAATGCVALSDTDRKLLAKNKVSCVHTPLAYLKNGQQPMDVAGTVKAGLNVALGTGGAVDAGSTDLFPVMRMTASLAREKAGNADAFPASAALMMATVCGARAQGRVEKTGMLKEGMDADLILVDFSAPHLIPCHNVLSALVFGAQGGDVAMTMVEGSILYQNGKFPTLDLAGAVETLTTYAFDRLFREEETQ